MAKHTTFVLDLDSTLVYAISDEDPEAGDYGEDADLCQWNEDPSAERPIPPEPKVEPLGGVPISFRSYDDYETLMMRVIPRPYVSEFLEGLVQTFDVGVWSRGTPSYVLEVAKILDFGCPDCNPEAKIQVRFVYDWTHCHRDHCRIFKPLKESPFREAALRGQACLIDDTPQAGDIGDPQIVIPAFEGDPEDTELPRLLVSLLSP